MTPIITTTLKRISSFLKTDAPRPRAVSTPFTQWNRSSFDSWTKAPSLNDVAKRRKAVRANLETQTRQTYAMYYS